MSGQIPHRLGQISRLQSNVSIKVSKILVTVSLVLAAVAFSPVHQLQSKGFMCFNSEQDMIQAQRHFLKEHHLI